MFEFEVYEVDCGFDSLFIRADLTRAEAPIAEKAGDGPWCVTPYQTADARHDAYEAALLVVGNDPGWYRRPDEPDTQPEDVIKSVKLRTDISTSDEEFFDEE